MRARWAPTIDEPSARTAAFPAAHRTDAHPPSERSVTSEAWPRRESSLASGGEASSSSRNWATSEVAR